MTVSEFAVAMYGCDVIKDKVLVLDSKENYDIIYDDRMEFLRYANEFDPKMAFANREVLAVKMEAAYIPKPGECVGDYLTIITI